MITEYILPQESKNKIDELNRRLLEIELVYSENISKHPFNEKCIREDFLNNPNVRMIEETIADIYEKSVEKILITFETEEEIKEFKEKWGIKEKKKVFDKIPEDRIKEIGKNETGKIETSTIGIKILDGEEKCQ